MAIFFNRVPPDLLGPGKPFTHYGTIHGFVPVYIGDPYGDCLISVRNGWPDWLEPLGRMLWELTADVAEFLNPDFEHPGWKINIQGEL